MGVSLGTEEPAWHTEIIFTGLRVPTYDDSVIIGNVPWPV